MKSNCCGASMTVVDDGGETKWYSCNDCGKACDPKVDTSPTSRLERKHYLSPNKKPVTANERWKR